MNDIAIILVSHYGDKWLRACLETVTSHVGDCSVDVVVANNAADATVAIVAEFPGVRVVRCANRGFAHANNRALETCDARYVLFLNVDTEVVEGTFADLVRALDARPSVGIAGVRQLTPDGRTAPTIRRFPNALRSLAEALGSERLPLSLRWLGERELDLSLYDGERACDWTSGSFLVARRAVIETVGGMDERFFLFSEEPDFCLRARRAGWETRHLPVMTIVHHGSGAGEDAKLTAQDAFSRLQFARKHFSPIHRAAYAAALGVGYTIRAVVPGRERRVRRAAARAALRIILRLDRAPFDASGSEPVAAAGA